MPTQKAGGKAPVTSAKTQGGKAPTTQAKAPAKTQGGKAPTTSAKASAKTQGGKAPVTQAKAPAKTQGGKAPTPAKAPAKTRGGKAPASQAKAPTKTQGGKAPTTPAKASAKTQGGKAPTTQAKASAKTQGGKALAPQAKAPAKTQGGKALSLNVYIGLIVQQLEKLEEQLQGPDKENFIKFYYVDDHHRRKKGLEYTGENTNKFNSYFKKLTENTTQDTIKKSQIDLLIQNPDFVKNLHELCKHYSNTKSYDSSDPDRQTVYYIHKFYKPKLNSIINNKINFIEAYKYHKYFITKYENNEYYDDLKKDIRSNNERSNLDLNDINNLNAFNIHLNLIDLDDDTRIELMDSENNLVKELRLQIQHISDLLTTNIKSGMEIKDFGKLNIIPSFTQYINKLCIDINNNKDFVNKEYPCNDQDYFINIIKNNGIYADMEEFYNIIMGELEKSPEAMKTVKSLFMMSNKYYGALKLSKKPDLFSVGYGTDYHRLNYDILIYNILIPSIINAQTAKELERNEESVNEARKKHKQLVQLFIETTKLNEFIDKSRLTSRNMIAKCRSGLNSLNWNKGTYEFESNWKQKFLDLNEDEPFNTLGKGIHYVLNKCPNEFKIHLDNLDNLKNKANTYSQANKLIVILNDSKLEIKNRDKVINSIEKFIERYLNKNQAWT